MGDFATAQRLALTMTTDVLQLRVIGVVLSFLCYTTSALPHSRNSTAALTNPCGIATNLLDTNDPGMKVTTEHLSDCADRPCCIDRHFATPSSVSGGTGNPPPP